MLEGTTIVISPLNLPNERSGGYFNTGWHFCNLINSTLTAEEVRETMDEVQNGQYRLLYIAPERLESPIFLNQLKKVKVPLNSS